MKKYVIVGANKNTVYKIDGDDLPGAKNTALDWKTFLDKEFKTGICLTDEYASRENILAELARLFGSLQKEDFAMFIYIGHGRQLKIKKKDYAVTKDETDGKDEALMCNGLPIYDDEIRLLLNLNLNKAPVFVVIDACYNPVNDKNGLVLNKFSSYNEIAFSSTSEKDKAYMENHEKEKQAIYSSFLLDVIKSNLDKNYNEIFDLTSQALSSSAKGYPQNPQLAFTNNSALKNVVFTSPVNNKLSFSAEKMAEIILDPNKSQNGIMKVGEVEKLASFIIENNLKKLNFKK